MGKLAFVTAEERKREPVTRLVERGMMTPETFAAMPEADRTAQVFVHFPGSTDEPQLVELHLEPGVIVEPHAHGANEILFVLEGSIHFGARTCAAGSSVLIMKDTLYTFRVGSEGVTFLNFRPSSDFTHYSKEVFLARQVAAQ